MRRLCWWLPVLALLYAIFPGTPSPARAVAADGQPPSVLMVLGDSLAAGYGLPQGQGFSERLGAALQARGLNVRVLNAGVSGDTSAGGLARLDWLLSGPDGPPAAALVELGANDALRGLDPARTRANLAAILERLKTARVKVLLAGMLAPPNMDATYARAFNAVYPDLAKTQGVALYPFFLEGVAGNPALNQADGIHPNEAGVARVVAGILPAVEKLLAQPAP